MDKLAKALDNSLAVVAAFTNTDVYPSSTWASQTEAASSRSGSRDGAHEAQSSSSNSSSSSGGWPVWPLQQQASMAGRSSRRKHSLVGFARAAGDGSLVSAQHARLTSCILCCRIQAAIKPESASLESCAVCPPCPETLAAECSLHPHGQASHGLCTELLWHA